MKTAIIMYPHCAFEIHILMKQTMTKRKSEKTLSSVILILFNPLNAIVECASSGCNKTTYSNNKSVAPNIADMIL